MVYTYNIIPVSGPWPRNWKLAVLSILAMSDWQARYEKLYEMRSASVSEAQWSDENSMLCNVIRGRDDFTYYLCLEADNTPLIFSNSSSGLQILRSSLIRKAGVNLAPGLVKKRSFSLDARIFGIVASIADRKFSDSAQRQAHLVIGYLQVI